MSPNYFDQAARFAARLDPAAFVCWLTRLPPEDLAFEGWLDTQSVPFPGDPDRRCDTVARVSNPHRVEPPWALVVEFQLEPEARMGWRMAEYCGRLGGELLPYKDDPMSEFQVDGVVVNLTGRGRTPREFLWAEAGLHSRMGFPDVNLRDLDAAPLLASIERGGRPRGLLPWVPLMRDGDAPDTMGRWRAAAEAEPNARRRAEYGGLALVFAEAADRRPAWTNALEGFAVRQSQTVLDWIAEAKAEAKWEERQRAIIELFEDKFGAMSSELSQRISTELKIDRLRAWLRALASAPTAEAFVAAMDASA